MQRSQSHMQQQALHAITTPSFLSIPHKTTGSARSVRDRPASTQCTTVERQISKSHRCPGALLEPNYPAAVSSCRSSVHTPSWVQSISNIFVSSPVCTFWYSSREQRRWWRTEQERGTEAESEGEREAFAVM